MTMRQRMSRRASLSPKAMSRSAAMPRSPRICPSKFPRASCQPKGRIASKRSSRPQFFPAAKRIRNARALLSSGRTRL